ncbi:MAG: formylmethanofuran dehydrogenase [Clostridia bacterium]|nr:formylmethanofuran dehydrogenase [Clostridia bacterium]
MDRQLWDQCVAFHGHQCPGLAIGFRAAEAALGLLGQDARRADDEEIVCVSENDACGVDAVQVITGCTMGKGNLLYRDTGKMAFSFFARNSGANVRLMLKPLPPQISREEKQKFVLEAPIDEVFKISKPQFSLPQTARIFDSLICEKCGEAAAEHKMRLQNNQRVCLDCFEEYSRGW